MWPRCVCGLSLRPAMSSIIRRRSGLTVLVSLMESSFLSEVHDTSILRTGALHRYHYLLTWLPISRLLLPRSGLERSDFVPWPISTVFSTPCPDVPRHQVQLRTPASPSHATKGTMEATIIRSAAFNPM